MAKPNASDSEATITTSLQPMRFTDILDTTFNLYRNHFRLFLPISAVYFFSHVAFSTPHFTHWETVFGELFVGVLCYVALTFASAQAYLGKQITARIAFRQVKLRFWNLFGSSLLYWLVAVLLGITIIGVPFTIYFLTRWGFYVQAVMVEETSATKAFEAQQRISQRRVVACVWYHVRNLADLVS